MGGTGEGVGLGKASDGCSAWDTEHGMTLWEVQVKASGPVGKASDGCSTY